MSDKSYTVAIKNTCKAIDIRMNTQLHICRIQGVALDVEEVDRLDKRSSCNCADDVFGTCYSTKLPLPVMLYMAGHDTRRGYFVLPRRSFFGYEPHSHLPL